MPKGPGFLEYHTLEAGHEALKRTTRGLRDMTPEPAPVLVWRRPLVLIVLRATLGFTPSERADAAPARTDTDVSRGVARPVDRACGSPLKLRHVRGASAPNKASGLQ